MTGESARRIPWTNIGYVLTAAWMVVVLAITGGDVTHPFFDYIFSVPLVLWIAALVGARLGKAWRGR